VQLTFAKNTTVKDETRNHGFLIVI